MAREGKPEEARVLTGRRWALLLIYTVVLTILWTIQTLFLPQPWASGYNIGPCGCTPMFIVLPYIFAIIAMFLMEGGLLKLDKQLFCLLYIVTGVTVWYSVYKGFYTIPGSIFNVRVTAPELYDYALPLQWMPSADAVRGMYYRGALHNFFVVYAREWAICIANYILWYWASIMFFLGWAGILRKLWVEIEVLPFPHAQGWLIAEEALAPQPTRFRRFLKIAFIIGFLIYVPYIIYNAYPGFPDLYGWATSPMMMAWHPGTYYASSVPAIAAVWAGPLLVSFDPVRYAIYFLVPLDGLLSLWVTNLVAAHILPQILTYFGYYEGIYTTVPWAYWVKNGMVYWTDPLNLETVAAGMALGILIFMILVHWRYLVTTLKVAFGSSTSTVEPGEVPYRMAWLLLIIGFLGLVGVFAWAELSPPVLFMLIFIIWLQVTVAARQRSYVGVISRVVGSHYWKILAPTIPPAPGTPKDLLFAIGHTNFWGSGADTFGPYYVTLAGAVDSFAVARRAGVPAESVFKVLIVTALISSAIVIPLTYLGFHLWGFMEIPVTKEWNFFATGDAGAHNPTGSILSPQGIFGFIFAGFLVFMKARFPWWPFEPLGALAGLCDWVNWNGSFVTPLVAWIAKYIMLKVGGRKAYDEIGVPFALGILAGQGLGSLAVSVTKIARFLIYGPV